MKRKKPELLLPAGNLETLRTAIRYGADAVYIGGEAFSLRAKADNFDKEKMSEAVAYAHEHGVRVYVTVNIFAHNADLKRMDDYILELKDVGPDALIISDPGVFMTARRLAPDMEIHISTQMNNTNYGDYLFWHGLGAKRVVSARELSLSELSEIRANIPEDMEIETFVHGAMCMAYSGRCLLSSFLTGRDSNRGACTHPCRWKYALCEEKREGQYFPIEEDERGTYIFNSRDLCMIEHIPELCGAGIDSFKVEGRMKTELYVASVARCYRRAIDDYFESEGEPASLPGRDKKMHSQGIHHRIFLRKGRCRGDDLRQQHLCEGIHLSRDRGHKRGAVLGCRRGGASGSFLPGGIFRTGAEE